MCRDEPPCTELRQARKNADMRTKLFRVPSQVMETLCLPQGKSLWPWEPKTPTSPRVGALPPRSPPATAETWRAVTPRGHGYLLLRPWKPSVLTPRTAR